MKVISLLLDFAFFQVEVIFVDFGNTETVNPSEMVLLDSLKKSVAEFPHQVSSYTEWPENTIYVGRSESNASYLFSWKLQ